MTGTTDTRDVAWFTSILDAMDDMVLVKGPRSRLLWANRAFRECYDLSNDELYSLIDGVQSDPDDTLQYVRDDRRVFVERGSIDVPSEPVTDHLGQTRFIHTKKSPVFDDHGEVRMQVGVSRTLAGDEPLESSRELREQGHASTRNVRALVRSMPAPVVMLDAAHRVIMWNDAFATIIDGLFANGDGPSSRLMHADYEEVLESRLPLVGELDAILHGAEPTSRTLEVNDADNRSSSFRVDCRTWTDASDIPSGTMAVFHDITGLLENQQQLRLANEELAQFNYRISHDIVAPISSARGCLALAFDEIGNDDPAEMTELLGDVHSQLVRLDQLVMDLSSLARAGAQTARLEVIDLMQLVDVLRTEHPQTTQKGIAIHTDLALAQLKSDPTRIRQMLSNLIDNAVKYIDPAESTRQITVRSRRENDMSVIEVSDNGIGIDPDFGERAFDMFTRGNSTTQGTGLGLYIISKHVERLGGTLSIVSNAKPTAMRITVPDPLEIAA